MYFSDLVEANPLMSALEPTSGLLGKEYAKEAEAESDHHLHLRATGARGAAAGLWRIGLEAVDGWTLRVGRGLRRRTAHSRQQGPWCHDWLQQLRNTRGT